MASRFSDRFSSESIQASSNVDSNFFAQYFYSISRKGGSTSKCIFLPVRLNRTVLRGLLFARYLCAPPARRERSIGFVKQLYESGLDCVVAVASLCFWEAIPISSSQRETSFWSSWREEGDVPILQTIGSLRRQRAIAGCRLTSIPRRVGRSAWLVSTYPVRRPRTSSCRTIRCRFRSTVTSDSIALGCSRASRISVAAVE